jgi:hypothetical protein
MANDRRNKDSRRAEDRRKSIDRRKSTDRRTKLSRRDGEAPPAKPTPAPAPEKKKVSKAEPKKKSSTGKLGKLFKMFSILLTVFVLMVTIVIVAIFSNLNAIMAKVAKRVDVAVAQATIDPASLTGRTTKAVIKFDIGNNLPVDIILKDFKFTANLSGYTIAKGVQILPKFKVESWKNARLPVQFHVDSIMARRGLQKAIRKNASKLMNTLLSRLQGKKKKLSEDLKGVMKISGTAVFKIKISGIEIPFEKILNFEKTQ